MTDMIEVKLFEAKPTKDEEKAVARLVKGEIKKEDRNRKKEIVEAEKVLRRDLKDLRSVDIKGISINPLAEDKKHCPKCGTLLMREYHNRYNQYHCIGCGLDGTWEDMVRQLPAIKRIYQETLSTSRCAKCNHIYHTIDMTSVFTGVFTQYFCPVCVKKREGVIL
jgi:predicted RNA-binding Zn-ribbon protein involved in translation (DUF1610 family)